MSGERELGSQVQSVVGSCALKLNFMLELREGIDFDCLEISHGWSPVQ